ncbi:hypothetical protein A374_10433 [Fictibacillus macauensis ZFHKF-1]|uniref:Uncharacterized protein n=1 Tax=Fictibacillus macauensis ZFHKF-1 TaxID=1196324 RepID=I8J1N4_9BACL|nr:hypothetical protein [Fictibacillus macauensis]EIT85646.1 hypothetical protein A374_10433 [Fictibacillus macauensis ZFHKF-1]
MLKFENSWPYDQVMNDIYVNECPFCQQENVLTSFSENKLQLAKEGIKQLLVMPCCHNKLTIVQADDDYFWSNEKLRNQ